MREAACFRCDWQGRTTAQTCPRCGTPLHRPEPSRPDDVRDRASLGHRIAPRSRPAGRHHPDDLDRGAPAPATPRSTTGQTSPWRILGGLGLVVIVITAASPLLRGGAGNVGRRPAAPHGVVSVPAQGHGSLVYTTVGPRSGRQVLWTMDLATGVSLRGPDVPPTVDIVDVSIAPGWVGLTTLAHGGEEAFLLRGTTAGITPTPLGRGEIVAWGTGGRSVALATNRHVDTGCERAVRLDVFEIPSAALENVLRERSLCGGILTIGHTEASTFFTMAERRHVGVFRTGVVGVPHEVLDGYAMLSASPVGDLLVTPSERPGAALFWVGAGTPRPLGTAQSELVVDRVLAWSADGAGVAVVGRLGDRPGVFLVRAGPSPRAPRYVVPAGDHLDATFDDAGTLFLVINGHVFSYRAGFLSDVLLPSDAPAPNGPIAWIP